MRTFRSFPSALALAALLGLAGAQSSGGVPVPGDRTGADRGALPADGEAPAQALAGPVDARPDSGPAPGRTGVPASSRGPGLVRTTTVPPSPSVPQGLAPALGRRGHPSTAPPGPR